ncbi:NAD(P)H-dependent oxidoreductase subunit E, partial [Gemmatimonadota bacterium]
MTLEYSQESRKALDAMRAEYPELRSVLIPALKLAQKDHGSLTKETIALAAAEAGVSEAVAAGVATFYHNLHTGTIGKHLIMICTTISCQLAGATAVVSRFEELL